MRTEKCSEIAESLRWFPEARCWLTRADAGSPGRQAAGRRAAVEGADVLRGQELRKDRPLETLGLTAQEGGALR